MENLNKNNFWDDLHKKYPVAYIHFCDFIDEYKKEVGWDRLFNAGNFSEAPKFHDLPIELQFGIIVRFSGEMMGAKLLGEKEIFEAIKASVRSNFDKINKKLKTTKQ